MARLTALPSEQVDTQVREWRVRFNLKQRNWGEVLNWIDRLTPEERRNPRWRYWRARALEAQGNNAEAQVLYRQLAGLRNYHGFLAAKRLGAPYRIQSLPLAVSPQTHDALLARSMGLQRARELYILGRHWEARVEWKVATRDFGAEDLKTAAKLAQSWDWHYQAIRTLVRTGYHEDLELRFPTPYRDSVLTHGGSENIDPAWIYAVMRQESLFQTDAKSHAGAMGLMQIMPATGQRIARELGTRLSGKYALLKADTNIRFGAHYLRHTLNELQDNPLLATAAYNAGPNRVAQWLPETQAVAPDLWAETIPYKETRKYAQRVMEYATIYEWRLGNAGGSIHGRMRTILPDDSGG
jgi:soluble lytic murein transglycosylase